MKRWVPGIREQYFLASPILREAFFLISCIVLFSLPIAAQEFSRVELYGGFQAINEPGLILPGFRAEIAGNFSPTIGLVGEFSFGTTTHREEGIQDISKEYTFLAGPRFSYQAKTFRVFAYLLAGAAHLSITREFGYMPSDTYWTKTGFAASAGLGLELIINNRISARLVQVDWLAAKLYDRGNGVDVNWAHQFRYSSGIVLKFGRAHK
jgi:hypothetical protein